MVVPLHKIEGEPEAVVQQEEVKEGGLQQVASHEKFGMTPFDNPDNQAQQYMSESHYNQPMGQIDQKIEERESLRHSTHRSQRSEKYFNQPDRMGQTEYSGENVERPSF